MFWQFLRAQRRAHAMGRRMAAVLRSTTDAIIEFDRGWRVTFVNERAKALQTKGGPALLGRSVHEMLPETIGTPVWEAAQRVMDGGEPAEFEFFSPRSGRWYFVRLFPTDGGVASYLQDITERHRMEERLRRSEEHLTMALSAARAGTFETDLGTGQARWSDETFRIMGLDPERDEPGLDSWLKLVHPAHQSDGFLAKREEIVKGLHPRFEVEYSIVRPDGAVRWLSAWGRVLFRPDGSPERMVGLTVDVTDQRQTENALRASEERFRALVDNAPQIMWINRPEGTVESINAAWRRYGGVEVTEENRWEIIHPDDRDRVRSLAEAAVAAGAPYESDYRLRRADGVYRWHVGRVNPMRQNGVLVAWIGTAVDVHAAREAQAEAEQANRAKSRFLAAASHDLRQPMQSLFLFTEVVRGHVATHEGRNALTMLERGLDTLKSLLDSLLDVSRLDAGVIKAEVAEVALGPLLEEVAASYAPIALSKGLSFTVDAACSTAIASDRTLLARMLRNLVENAVRYTDDGFVRLRCRADAKTKRLHITVEDSGVGIPKEHLDRIFEEFHQVGNPERDRAQGLGLGLAIVERLSALLDHPVEVRSEVGKGSAFTIAVPLATGTSVPSAPVGTALERSGRDRLAVLVDDDAIVLLGLRAMLQDWDYEVLIAGSTDQALERLKEAGRSPDIVVADYRLRDGRVGTEAILRIRELVGAQVPGVILTGETGAECHRDAQAHGLGLLHKPVTPRQLHGMLEEHLRLVRCVT
ncbi:hybrid sensor histidine kinase/response regulator [Azospirillum canadense]|uniref:hybrid sensor histidine kinase/response regulator n=1 Tax=Azospirillum canadense TaxID=403962 RepID=UPI0022279511|nr:PAS domain-containing protein [Azospirillum canadense]MCW2236869.1 PAS domain S-box-containing protein [Azospirillum canadense]